MEQQPGKINPPPPPSTPRLAPWEHVEELVKRLDRLIELLEQWAPAVPGVPGVPGAPGEPVTVIIPWQAGKPVEIYRDDLREIITTQSEMVNWTTGKRLLLAVNNKLDQDVLIQVIGSIKPTVIEATDIGPILPCPAKSRISVGLAWDDWHPYIGCEITVAVIPTDGTLIIEAVVQE
ncbi:hypothetical protein ES703_51292 [subsurface metagenome]